MLDKYEDQLNILKNSIEILQTKMIQAVDACEAGVDALDVAKLQDAREALENFEENANEVDQIIIKIFALFTPEAAQLRELIAFLKITNELVRIKDNVNSFAKRMQAHIKNEVNLDSLTEYSNHLAKSAFKAIAFSIKSLGVTRRDDVQDLFRNTCVEESKTDDLYSVLEKNVMSDLYKNIPNSPELVEVLRTMRKLERMADRSVNITRLMLFARVGGEFKQFK